MGQCLSHSARAPRASEAGGRVIHGNINSPTAPLPSDGQSAQRAGQVSKADSAMFPFPRSESDAISAQPSTAQVMIEGSAARGTPCQDVRVCHADARQLHQHSQQILEDKRPATKVSLEQQGKPGTLLAGLSTCVSGASTSSSGCLRVKLQQAGYAAAEDQREGAMVDTDEVIIQQAGCCGPVSRKEVAMKAESGFTAMTKEAFENGLAGNPHDVLRYGAPRPANEESRMATVRALRTMNMQECSELDLILKVICRIWQAPAACVTLLDSDHVFICSAEGAMSAAHRPWCIAMCPWMLLGPNPSAMAVGDLTADARFSKSLHVAGGTRSYLTSPLVASNGHRLGAICFTDVKPRRFDVGDCRLMNNCAELAVRALESHLNVRKRLGLTPAKRHTKPLTKLPRMDQSGSSGGRWAGDLDTDDGTLMEEYTNRVRDLAEVDEAVVLLLDTREPAWTILYVSPSWEALTGLDRAEAMGATLNQVMAHASGDTRVVWEGVEREAAAGKAFVTPRVYCKARPSVTFYLSFRPAASEDLDDQTVTLGVPASVQQIASATSSKLFFARLHITPDPPANSLVNSLAPSAIFTTGRRLPPNIAINPVQGLTELFEGLVVGQVLGQGSYGTVYHARWHGVDVAIKVQDMHIRNAEERARAEFEVGLSQRLHHINVVHTLSHASALLERSNPSGALDSNDSDAWSAGLQFAPLGYMFPSRHSTGLGPSVRGSTAAGTGDNTAMAMEGAPAFIPFFAGVENGLAAAVAAAAAAAGAAGASINGVEDAPSLVDGPAAPMAAGDASSGGGGGGGPASQMKVVSVGTPTAAPASSLGVASESQKAFVRVALPSGVQVPMLRNTQRTIAATATAAAAGNGPLPPLAALIAAGGSSPKSGSPSCPLTPDAATATPPLSFKGRKEVVRAYGTAGTSPSAPRSRCGSDLNAKGTGETAGGEGSLTITPFLTMNALANAGVSNAAELGSGGEDVAMVTLGGGGGDGGGSSAAAVSGANGLSFGKGAFGSIMQVGSGTQASGGGNVAISGAEDLTAILLRNAVGKPAMKPAQQQQEPWQTTGQSVGGDEAAQQLQQGENDEQQQVPQRQQSQEQGPQRQQSQEPPPQRQPSDTLALSGAYQGIPLLPYSGGAATAGFGIINIPSAAMDRMAAGGGSGSRAGEVTNTAAVASAMQSAIGADLSGLSYPLDVRLWMVLEFMDKGSLQDAIDRGWLREGRTADHAPDYPAVLATAQEIAASVAYLHSHDVVHGDLSAVNVLLQSVRQKDNGSKPKGGEPVDHWGRGFIAKISDFGLSMQLKRSNEIIKTGAYGTITHMAPEVLRDSTLSKPADVYSIGVLLWQMVTGSRPWAGLSHLQVSVEVGTHMRQLQWPPWVHNGVRLLGQRCMSPRPEERPAAAQMEMELAELMRQVPQYG